LNWWTGTARAGKIEIIFNILKNACQIETLQLSRVGHLERALALALFMIIVWRTAHLMRLGRTCPDLDAAQFFHPDEIRGAYLLRKKQVQESRHNATRCCV